MTTISASGRLLGLGAVAVMVGLLQTPDAAAQQGERVAEGARLYGQTCARCHNPRPATERTDRDWSTIMGHMRTRANLSKLDTRAILAFLQATNGSPGKASAGNSSSDAREPAGREGRRLQSALMVLSGERLTAASLVRAIVSPIWTVGRDYDLPDSSASPRAGHIE